MNTRRPAPPPAPTRNATGDGRRPVALGAALLGALAGGCAVGPDYKPPERATRGAYAALAGPPPAASEGDGLPAPASVPTSGPASGPADLASWWARFEDPALNRLVERAVLGNLDLKIATARVQEARALRGVSRADLFPTVDATGSYARYRSSENRVPGLSFGSGDDRSLWTAGLDATWEIDVFGGIRRRIEAADADLRAAEEARRDTMVTLVAEVARNYAEARGLWRRLDVARRTVGAQEETLGLSRARLEAGLASELDVAQATAQLETRRAIIPALVTAHAQAIHRLGVLLGQEPASLAAELAGAGAPLAPPASVPVGLPSELLLRRPDVRRAERELASATARIGVATSELYPRFSISGAFGFESARVASLFDMDSRAWSVGPSVRWNVFDARRIRDRINAAGAVERQAMAAYERAVLQAFEEVENRLVAFTQEQSRRESLRAAAAANARAVALSDDLFRAGLRDFLNVLDSQRAAYDAEDQLVQSDVAVTTNLIALYKALGGGWENLSPDGVDVARAPAPTAEPAAAVSDAKPGDTP